MKCDVSNRSVPINHPNDDSGDYDSHYESDCLRSEDLYLLLFSSEAVLKRVEVSW